MGPRARSGPDGQRLDREEGPRHRDDGRAQRVRDGRERPGLDPAGARPLLGFPLAQLRPLHDRREVRSRERADRPPAGVLPDLLPARQRGAAHRRPFRRGEDARARRPSLFANPRRPGAAAQALHARSDAGRRAGGLARADRRRPGHRRGVPRALGRGAGRRRGRPADGDPDLDALGPPLQGPRRDEEGELGRRILHGAPRSGLRHVRRRGPDGPADLRRADGTRGDARRGGRRDAGDTGGSRPGAGDAPEEHRADAQQRQSRRTAALRVHRPGRLAALLPQPRPDPSGHGRRRAEGGRGVPEAIEPDDRGLPADREARPRRDSAAARRRGARAGLQGRRGRRRGRSLRSLAGQHRGADEALGTARGDEARPSAEEDARRDGRRQPHAPVRRREDSRREVDRRGHGGRHADARHDRSTRASRSRTSSTG